MAKIVLEIRGMHCAGCARRLGKVLEAQPGVSGASVDFLKSEAVVESTGDATVDIATIAAAIEAAGFVFGAARAADLT